MKKVLSCIISKKETPITETLSCLTSVMAQDYSNFSVMMLLADSTLHEDKEANKRLSIVKNENDIKVMALASDADYFFLVDTDVELPKNAITSLMLQLEQPELDEKLFVNLNLLTKEIPKQIKKHAIGGWFRLGEKQYNCARWVADNTLIQLPTVENSVVKVDKIDLGCLMVSRELLSQLNFRLGDCVFNENHGACTCLMMSKDIQDLGHELWMDGSVICKHKGMEG